ncbi:hypothetical protein ACFW9D_14435 [Streptomyces sp. NPDC059524]|uniref:hypothetical protein n=1 Tax=Streptomyces sp. NPDC059524 TaxID=3346856 RepID=UPI0036804524
MHTTTRVCLALLLSASAASLATPAVADEGPSTSEAAVLGPAADTITDHGTHFQSTMSQDTISELGGAAVGADPSVDYGRQSSL